MSAKSPNTRRRLLLDSLESVRLADLCGSLLFPAASWLWVERMPEGSTGPDFRGSEAVAQGVQHSWWIRILRDRRRMKSIADIADEAIQSEAAAPDVLLVVLTFDVSDASVEALRDRAGTLGIRRVIVWSRSTIERVLHEERPDLLFAYFGVSIHRRWNQKVRALRRRVLLKKRLAADLLKDVADRDVSPAHPFEKFRFAKILLRSVDDESYPTAGATLGASRGWMEVATYDFYHDGIEVILGTVDVVIDENGYWAPIRARLAYDEKRFRSIRAFEIGRIPFEQIADHDVAGDEYYREPHLFCIFAAAGTPFAAYRYASVEDPFRVMLSPKMMLEEGPEMVKRPNSADVPSRKGTKRTSSR